jgi:hypothetical protein
MSRARYRVFVNSGGRSKKPGNEIKLRIVRAGSDDRAAGATLDELAKIGIQ